MEYRTLGRTGVEVSAIGLGTEYLIDQPAAKVATVIRGAVDRGISYFDLFFAQPRFRDQMGEALVPCRDRVVLAAHLGAADVDGQYQCIREPQACERFFLDFLRRYRTECADLLYLHNSDTQEDLDLIMGPGGLLEMARRFQQEGKTRFIGFSGHNTSTARRIVESGAVDALMFPVNLTSHAMPGRSELFAACAEHDVGLVAMKPYAGGNLLTDDAAVYVDTYKMGRAGLAGAPLRVEKAGRITAGQCMSYVLSQPEVATVVPGAADLEQLDEAMAWLEAGAPERDVSALLPAFERFGTGECVHCNHCLPCPSEIDIGQTLRLLQLARGELTDAVRQEYEALPAPASDCVECGDCVERCPFGVEVAEQMAEAAAVLG
ncbi:aldo/keto reductase [Candidatus Latescibacterota bacterium]